MNHFASLFEWRPSSGVKFEHPAIGLIGFGAIAVAATALATLLAIGAADDKSSRGAASPAAGLAPTIERDVGFTPIDAGPIEPANATCIPLGVCVPLPREDGVGESSGGMDRYIVG